MILLRCLGLLHPIIIVKAGVLFLVFFWFKAANSLAARITFMFLLQFLRLLHPFVIFKDRVVEHLLKERRPSQSTSEWQVSLGRLFDVVSELGSTKPTLLALHLPIRRRPANFSAKEFKVSLGLLPLLLLDRVSKLSARELVPQSLDRRQVGRGNVLDFREINKGTPFGLGSRKNN
jgi:hypothetical protein